MKLDDQERRYLEGIEAFTEEFGRIQRDFVLQKHGVQAVIRFIEDFSGTRPAFKPDDPVMVKGRGAAERAIEDLKREFQDLHHAEPPPQWKLFHATLLESVRLQLEGYREMVKVFDDSDVEHLRRGKIMIEKGMGLLEAGER